MDEKEKTKIYKKKDRKKKEKKPKSKLRKKELHDEKDEIPIGCADAIFLDPLNAHKLPGGQHAFFSMLFLPHRPASIRNTAAGSERMTQRRSESPEYWLPPTEWSGSHTPQLVPVG